MTAAKCYCFSKSCNKKGVEVITWFSSFTWLPSIAKVIVLSLNMRVWAFAVAGIFSHVSSDPLNTTVAPDRDTEKREALDMICMVF
jgi:hypothetical protein